MDRIIKFSRGLEPVDTLITNVKLVNTISGEIYQTSIAIAKGLFAGFGDYEAKEVIDGMGMYASPGFIDAHIHIESSLLSIGEFARAVVPLGTTSIIADPHEFANVLGIMGIDYLLDPPKSLPLDIFVMAPSCVPATDFETSGARLLAEDLRMIIDHPNLIGLAEVMNYPGVLFGDTQLMKKIELFAGKPVDGHAPRLSGKDLCAYIAAGIQSEHEATELEEAREKLRFGMHIHLREGSTEKNLRTLLPLVKPENARQFSFATDDRHPASLINEGHIDNNIRIAIAEGLDPIVALSIASTNTARFYNLNNLGAFIPGYNADFVLFDDIDNVRAKMVFKNGNMVAENGEMTTNFKASIPAYMRDTIKLTDIDEKSFAVKAEGKEIRVIEVVPDQILTKATVDTAKIDEDGYAVSDIERDLLKLAVIERHNLTGNIGLGFVRGFGLKKGAMASTVGHDSHNITVVGTNDADMLEAVLQLNDINGGYVVVSDGEVLAELPLPIAGLVSAYPLHDVKARLDLLHTAAGDIGCVLEEPFSILSFLPLTPVPELRLTDKGLFDVVQFDFTSLFR